MNYNGIDISYHQGDIDFNKLKGNIDFAMVRASYGCFHKDTMCDTYVKNLERINVPYGLYHFSYATNIDEAKEEAYGFLSVIKNYNPTYPVVMDVESSNVTKDLTKDMLVNIVNTFCEIVESNGYYVMIYSNLNYFDTKLNSTVLNKYDKWLAQWAQKPTYKEKFGIWQYSSKGKKPGIKGNVDLDISYVDYPKIIRQMNNDKKDYISYVVKKGDTLIKIAKKYNTTYQKLAEYNNIKNPNLIYPNQIIKIPINNQNINPSTYVVKKGDTLINIAKKYNLNWKDLYKKNKDVIGSNPNKIYPGQVLKL